MSALRGPIRDDHDAHLVPAAELRRLPSVLEGDVQLVQQPGSPLHPAGAAGQHSPGIIESIHNGAFAIAAVCVRRESMRISRDSDSDPCPVPDDLLGDLYRANKNGLPELIATVSPDVRAALAMYCYRRGHLKSIGLAIASTCNKYDLEVVGGTAGAALYARSREAAPAPPVASQYVARQKITLASGSLRKSLPIDDDVDLDDIDLDD